MQISDLQNKLIAVLGYGMEGQAVTNYLIKHGIKPVLFDQKPWEKWEKVEQEQIKSLNLSFIFGPDCFKELGGFDVVFRSPGIRLSDIKKQLSNNAFVTSQTKWFFENCSAKIIGITGTKGKGTTSALIYEMLKTEGKNTYLTGNIGKIQPLEVIDLLSDDDFVVYELSSFQLQDLNLSPHIAVVLMVTSEHMDYHKDIKEYHEAKTAIAKFQNEGDLTIINNDFPAAQAIGSFGKAKKLYFSKIKQVDPGCFIKDGNIISTEFKFQFPTNQLQLRGDHNLENICAAILTALSLNVTPASIKKVLKSFKGLENRLEFVTEKHGVKFYNDSFSTTPETAIAAINSFNEPEIIILGGSSKNSDFTELVNVIADKNNIKAIILIGQEAVKIKSLMLNKNALRTKIFEGAKDMPEIITQVMSVAEQGNVVVLSPACASFDMFRNYNDRGEQFKKEVLNLD